MKQLLDILDVLTYGAAASGGALAILWIYNSTIRERRELLRRAGKAGETHLRRTLAQGLFFHRLSFAVAAAATAVAILLFARRYRACYGTDIAPAYIVAAITLAVLSIVGGALALWGRRKED